MTKCWIDIRSKRETGGRVLPVWLFVALSACVAMVLPACGGGPKPIHHYQPEVLSGQMESKGGQSSGELVLAIEDFSAGAAYDEQRIVYRSNEYRFDYYHYHRWAATPGLLVSDVLREVYRNTGAFRAVVGGYDTRADVVLSGRVIAFEEVDVSKDEWLGRVVLNLRLRDARTGELLWNDRVSREVPLSKNSPEGLAASLSKGLTDIGVSTADDFVQVGNEASRRRTEDTQNEIFQGANKSDEAKEK